MRRGRVHSSAASPGQMAQLRQAVTQNPGQVLELVEDGYALSGESLALLRERAAEAASGRGPLTEVGD